MYMAYLLLLSLFVYVMDLMKNSLMIEVNIILYRINMLLQW